MKLIYCPQCHDVVKLAFDARSCECEASHGYYKADGLNAVYSGLAVPLGFANHSFQAAILDQPDEGMGGRFEAFIIPKSCPTCWREE